MQHWDFFKIPMIHLLWSFCCLARSLCVFYRVNIWQVPRIVTTHMTSHNWFLRSREDQKNNLSFTPQRHQFLWMSTPISNMKACWSSSMSNPRKKWLCLLDGFFQNYFFCWLFFEWHALLHLKGKCRPHYRLIYVEKRNIIATETQQVCLQLQNRWQWMTKRWSFHLE